MTDHSRLRELAAQATPGPWTCERICLDGHEWSVTSAIRELPPFDWKPRLMVGLPPLTGFVGNVRDGRGADTNGSDPAAIAENRANAEFIAAARSAVPGLLAEVDRLRAALPSWTATPPTAAGWYWWRRNAESRPTIRDVDGEGVRWGWWVGDYWTNAATLGGEWTGPIQPPH